MKETWPSVVRHVDEEALIELARETLRIPSYSGGERDVAEVFAKKMREIGLDTEIQEVPASPLMGASCNALGRLNTGHAGPSLLFNGHLDHNPVCDGWTKDPFGGVIEHGWLYGFVHMKAANAAYLAAVQAVLRSGVPLCGDVTLAHVCGELCGGVGTQHALKQGLKADYFVLGEPTELETAFNHTASIVVRIHVLGRMKHFATVDAPDARGVNAVEKMAKLIPALGPSHKELPPVERGGWLSFRPAQGFEGLPQLNIGPIRGGIGRMHSEARPALFPDRCTQVVDFRLVPGMSKETIERDLVRLLNRLSGEDSDFRYELEFQHDTFPLPFAASPRSPIARSLVAAHAYVNGEPPQQSTVLKFAASDASWMAAAGITGVVYGPSGRYLSRPDERCETKDLVRAARTYACVIADICSRP